MQKIHFSTYINAPRQKVWDTMLNKETYEQWTTPFSAGSTYEGKWEEGSEIRFIGPDPETGKTGGMLSKVKESRPPEFISLEHLGVIKADGSVDTESEEVKKWAGAHENYTFIEKDGGTEVQVDIDVAEEYKDMFNGMWPQALQLLKDLAEK